MLTLVLAGGAGALIGLSLGALGGGGSVLAVPVLVHLLGQSPAQATTGSLVVVGVTSLLAAVTAHRAGTALVGRGVVFGFLAVAGATVGSLAAARVPEAVLMAAFATLLLLVSGLMVVRTVQHRAPEGPRVGLDDPIITFWPTFTCRCPRALQVLVTATAVGLLTGFLGVGGGFLVVPALVLALGLDPRFAAGTSLVVITVVSAAALAVRTGSGVAPDWPLVAVLTVVSTLAAVAGARLAARIDARRLSAAFTALVVTVALLTTAQAALALR
ncbi:sulfite exporter TauE/SafE family protein [Blastococcus sp. TF02-8]|uniref:sulfite exporter TauE/SafE family protein n=1 Tax=Blastococcus sp. TF02-8 TaxID=2250574 RepID=UPI000DEBBA8B|nr:sulfite exporter TauE/SafE family protein [Blastococcus sp. TF02-8]RBY96540.1 sulfite exporter TauE/SafE family protein [Blastococcus sp. TF02-8]